MKWISSAGIDVVCVSWYPAGKADDQGYPWDSLIPTLLNVSHSYKLKVAFHLEPYEGMTARSVRDGIEYIIKHYGSHPAFYRTTPKKRQDKQMPLFYAYDSYKIPAVEWSTILTSDGSMTIRNTEIDSLVIGLILKLDEAEGIAESGFDGIYTYFAADGFTQASTMNQWPALSKICAEKGLLFIPSVGPGYDDTKIRPWNAQTTRNRTNGEYYKQHFEMAHTCKADVLSITSFNEWHEGTQIEPAVHFNNENGTTFSYGEYPKGPHEYLQLTNELIRTYFVAHHENIPLNIAKIL